MPLAGSIVPHDLSRKHAARYRDLPNVWHDYHWLFGGEYMRQAMETKRKERQRSGEGLTEGASVMLLLERKTEERDMEGKRV